MSPQNVCFLLIFKSLGDYIAKESSFILGGWFPNCWSMLASKLSQALGHVGSEP